MQDIPVDLGRRLPPAPRGTRYIYVDNQVLLVNVNTRLVLDFINIPEPVEYQDAYTRNPAPKIVDQIPSEQHPSQSHQPPSHARAYEIAKGRPFTDDEHPSSHGQGHQASKGKPPVADDHPVSHAQNNQDEGSRADKGKPLWGDDHPSSQGKNHKRGQEKPDKRKDRPSAQAKGNQGHGADQGKPLREDGSAPEHANIDQDNRGGAQKSKDHPSTHAKADMGHQDRPQQSNRGSQGGPPKGHDRPSPGKDKSSMENPMEDDSGSYQMNAREKPGKGGPQGRGRGKPKDTFAGSSEPQDFSEQPLSSPEENIQIAKVERGRGKNNPKGPGKGNKKKRVTQEQQTDMTAAVTHPEPAPGVAPHEPAATASFEPLMFDNHQRSIIQSYFQNSGSKKAGRNKGKSTKGPKRNKTSSVAKNEILTQPTEPLPQGLESQLPPAPPNTRRVLVHRQVLLLESGTNRVLDVINVND